MAGNSGKHVATRRPPTEEAGRQTRKTVVTYHVAPTSFLGRLLAFVLAIVILVAALFISFLVFWVVLTIVLFLIVYALWASRRAPRKPDRVIDAERKQE